ncbi:benenodin family lasso peptide [Luteimonas changyuni]
MNTNEDTRVNAPEEVIALGIASEETKGGPLSGEFIGGNTALGISEE